MKVTADYFTVLTTAGEPAARKWAVELAEFRRGLQALVPVSVERLRPVTVVLFKSDRAMEPYLPLENGQPARIGGLFVRTNDLNTIMLSLARPERETRHVIFHEAVHWHLGALGQSLPLWLSEGLAELFATFEVADATRCQIGSPLPGHVAQLDGSRLLPLAQLVATQPGSVLYNETRRGNIFYAESWALVHLLLLGDGAEGGARLKRYIELQRSALTPDAAFRTAFGGSYEQVEARLRAYMRERNFRPESRPHAEAGVACVVSAVSAGEVELTKGSLLAGSRDAATGEAYLRRATELMPRDPRAWELLGISLATRAAATTDGKLMDQAAAYFRRAIAVSPRQWSSYEGLAGLVYSMATFQPDDATTLAHGLALAPDNRSIEVGLAACEIRAGNPAAGRQRLERICALDPERATSASRYALRILTREHYKTDLAEVEKLAGASRFHEAVAVLDRALARDLAAADRQVMMGLRRGLSEIVKATPAAAVR